MALWPQQRPLRSPRDDLIQGTDIELAPARRTFQEHYSNPGLEVVEHSNLEVSRQAQAQAQPFGFPPSSPFSFNSYTPPPPPVLQKPSWDKLPSYGEASSTTPRLNTSYTFPGSAPDYSAIDFTSPFDQQPLVAGDVNGGRGERSGAGGKGMRERLCAVRRRLFWVLIGVGVFLAVLAIAVGVGVGVSGKKGSSDGR
jgi:hypothetical protein